MSYIPKPQEIYKHFKGNLYQVVTIAKHSETGEALVVYQALYGDFSTYARPLDMFVEKVDREKYPECSQVYRFELQGAPDPRLSEVADAADGAVGETKQEAFVDSSVRRENAVEEKTEELQLDPMLLQFLDADTYEERLGILTGLQHRITDEMITTMAIACDIEVGDGNTMERYDQLRSCLITLEHYECNRMR